MTDRISDSFPKIGDVFSKKTSEQTPRYNCIAWAFGDSMRWWWPSHRTYWPFDPQGMAAKLAFDKLFADGGWQKCSNRSPEAGYQKIALYELSDGPTHAARQLESGLWTSKLGEFIDIAHELEDIEGPAYGVVSAIYRRRSK